MMAEGQPSSAPETSTDAAADAQQNTKPSPEPPASAPAPTPPPAEENLPLREDFIQNAVKFLSHPKVQGSPVQYRRSFLEKKGLNGAEITEAFRRVPDTAAAPPAPLPATTTVTTTTTTPSPATAPAVAPRPSAVPKKPWEQSTQPSAAYSPSNQVAAAQLQQVQAQPRQGMRWTQMVLALGLLSAAGAGTFVLTKEYLAPRLKRWLRRWLLDISEEAGGMRKLTPVEEAANAAAEAASAAAQATKIMKEAKEDIKGVSAEGDRKLEAILAAFQGQTRELTGTLNSLKTALEGMEASRKEAVILGTAGHPEGAPPVSLADLRKELLKFTSVVTGFSGAPPATEAPSSDTSLTGADISELKALVQARKASTRRGPPVDQEFTESEDGLNWLQPPEAVPQYESAPKGPVNVPVDRRALGTTGAGRAGPASQGLSMQPASAAVDPTYRLQENGPRPASANFAPRAALSEGLPDRPMTSPPQAPDVAPHSKSYMDVLQMLKEGKPIPGIRDIDDKPPNPNQPPTDPKLKPRAKPWEKGFQQVSEKLANGPATPAFNVTNTRDGALSSRKASPQVYSSDGQAPWWRPAQPQGYKVSQPSQDAYLGESVSGGMESESFVHPALAGEIEGPGPEATRSGKASGMGDSSKGGRITELPDQAPRGEVPQSGSSSRSTSGAGGSQEPENNGGGSGSGVLGESSVPAGYSKPAWRPPAVPSFAMPSAADAIKGKGKMVPVTPMASSARRDERVGAVGVHSEPSQGEGSSQSANGEVHGGVEVGTSDADAVEVGASRQGNDELSQGENAE